MPRKRFIGLGSTLSKIMMTMTWKKEIKPIKQKSNNSYFSSLVIIFKLHIKHTHTLLKLKNE